MFTPPEKIACRRLIELALAEDLGAEGDVTSRAVIPIDMQGSARFVARWAGVVAGLPAAELVLTAVDKSLKFKAETPEGGVLATPGTLLATVSGTMHSLLAAERIALNFLQRLSGIATLTRRYVDAIAGLRCRILDTRKTTPGWRLLEKYAVRCGGGHNHRLGLHDGVLIKDNHLAALGHQATDAKSITRTVELARATCGALPVEVEVDTLAQFDEALACAPDMILLDNMTPADMREAVRRREEAAANVLLEASGGVTLDTVRGIAETGVDRISVGALTHSAAALDIALDYTS